MRQRFLDVPRGARFQADAYGSVVFRKINGREAEVVESQSYFVCPVGEVRRMGYRLYVSNVRVDGVQTGESA